MLLIPLCITLFVTLSKGSPFYFLDLYAKQAQTENPFVTHWKQESQKYVDQIAKYHGSLEHAHPFFTIPNSNASPAPTFQIPTHPPPFQVPDPVQAPPRASTSAPAPKFASTPVLQFGNSTNSNSKISTVQEICGLSTLPFIVRGDAVQPGEYPWLGALFYKRNDTGENIYICTVNLVTKQHVLTAAHCVTHHLNVTYYSIIMGSVKQNVTETTKIIEINAHSGYVHGHPSHDIAILTLEQPVSFNTTLKPICLWSTASESIRAMNSGWIAGYGPDYTQFRKVQFPIVSQERCRGSHVDFHYTTSEFTFCAGTRDNKGPCFGDSGAGFMQNDTGRMYLRGIVSYGLGFNGNCNLKQFIIFADINKELEWVHMKLKSYL